MNVMEQHDRKLRRTFYRPEETRWWRPRWWVYVIVIWLVTSLISFGITRNPDEFNPIKYNPLHGLSGTTRPDAAPKPDCGGIQATTTAYHPGVTVPIEEQAARSATACLTVSLSTGVSAGCGLKWYYTIPYYQCSAYLQPGNASYLFQVVYHYLAATGRHDTGDISNALCSTLPNLIFSTACSYVIGPLFDGLFNDLHNAWTYQRCAGVVWQIFPGLPIANFYSHHFGGAHWAYPVLGPDAERYAYWVRNDGCAVNMTDFFSIYYFYGWCGFSPTYRWWSRDWITGLSCTDIDNIA